jgi:rod shape determining protein RodA
MNRRNPDISKGIDWLLVWLYVALCVIGLVCVFSVEYRSGENIMQGFLGFKKEYSKQFFFFGISIVVAILILLTDSKFFTAIANLSYLGGILLIMATFVVGKTVGGSKSWIPLGIMNIQPVEVCKIFTSLAIAKYMSSPDLDFQKPRSQMIAAAIAFAPAVLSVAQKEPGAALVYFSFAIAFFREGLPVNYLVGFIAFVVLIIASIVVKKTALLIILTAVALFLIYLAYSRIKRSRAVITRIVLVWAVAVGIQTFLVPTLFQKVLKPHQVVRIFAAFGIDDYKFTDPKRAAEIEKEYSKLGSKRNKDGSTTAGGESYNVKQSKIAIGSGGLWGKGFLKGTQTTGDFVPAQNTDFIFSTVGESFGFWGTTLLMILYFGLMLRIVFVAERQRSTFSRVYAYCVAGILFVHVFLNICMTIGLAPSPGITLPFLSYGGSSLLTFTSLLFILIKLDADRQMVLR